MSFGSYNDVVLGSYMSEFTLSFFISNLGQVSALKVTYILKFFGAPSCLMVAQQFDLVTSAGEECNNFQDSKSMFLISAFNIFPIMLLRQLNFGLLSAKQPFYFLYEGKTLLFFNLQFLLLLSEKGLSPEVAQQFAIRGLVTGWL